MFDIKELPLDSIQVSDRIRIDKGDLLDLSQSLEREGQLMPILVDENYRLIAGERRLLAAQELEWETLHARIIPGLSPDASMMIEWIENAARKQFSWQEELEAKARLHRYYTASTDQWGYRDTARKLQVSLGGLSTDLELAKAMEQIPELKQYQTKGKAREAYKKLQSQAQAITAMDNLSPEEQSTLKNMMHRHEEHKDEYIADTRRARSGFEHELEQVGKIRDRSEDETESNELPSHLPKFIYEICSFESVLDRLPVETVGFTEIDPPYAIDFNSVYGRLQNIDSTEVDWTIEEFHSNMDYLLRHLYDKLMDTSWILCWTGAEHETFLQELALDAGYGIQSAGIWVKPSGGCNSPATTMIHNYEKFLLFRKGQATFNVPSMQAAVSFNPVPSGQRFHQWQKPIEMYRHFFRALARPGSLFFSPFAGSGMSMIVSTFFGMTPVGCDKSRKYFYQFYTKLKEHHYESTEQSASANGVGSVQELDAD